MELLHANAYDSGARGMGGDAGPICSSTRPGCPFRPGFGEPHLLVARKDADLADVGRLEPAEHGAAEGPRATREEERFPCEHVRFPVLNSGPCYHLTAKARAWGSMAATSSGVSLWQSTVLSFISSLL
jgi:hypothetical protein